MTADSLLETYRFEEFEAYTDAIEGADLRTIISHLKHPFWSLCKMSLDDSIHIQVGAKGSGNIIEGVTRRDAFAFYLQRKGTEGRANGMPLTFNSVFLMPPGSEFCIVSDSPQDWMTIFIPNTMMASTGLISDGPEVVTMGTQTHAPATGATDNLWSLIERFQTYATTDSRVTNKQALLTAFREALLTSISQLHCNADKRSLPNKGRPASIGFHLISTAVEMIEEAPDMIATVQDLATAIGVSERTLRSGFNKYFGVSPYKYMQLRRLHRAKNMLLNHQVGEITIAEVAVELGMYDLGRFAGRYQSLYGELPLDTLRRGKKEAVQVFV